MVILYPTIVGMSIVFSNFYWIFFGDAMYNTIDTAERIKVVAKSRKLSVKVVLEECGLNKNVLSTMLSRGSMPKADNLARIADYLNCSVDYLLGRTDNPEINR